MTIRTPGRGNRRPGLGLVCVSMFAVCSLLFDHFLSADNLAAIAQSSAIVLIAAMGQTALLVSHNIDVSIGSMLAVDSVAVAVVDTATGSGIIATLAGIGLGAMLGAANGVLVEFLGISSLIVTLAMLALYRGIAYLVSGSQSVGGLSKGFTEFAQSHPFGVPLTAVVAAVTFLGCAWMLSMSVTGLRLFAIGGERQVAGRLGIRVPRLVVLTFVINGGLVGLAAVLTTAVLANGSPTAGVGFEMDVLTAVILGGVAFTGGQAHPVGVLFGVATIGILNAGLIFAGLPESSQLVARGGLLLIALTADQLVLRWRRQRTPNAVTYAGGADVPAVPLAPPPEDCSARLENVDVEFPGVQALTDVSLELHGGEVVCLVGDNGAGKSVLIHVLSGDTAPSSGHVVMAGSPVPADPHEARAAGVETVFQQPAICPNLSGVDNLVLGREPRRKLLGFLMIRDLPAARQAALERLSAFGIGVRELDRPASTLSGGQRQQLAIMRVVRPDARLVLFDEPTASLGVQQGSSVLDLVRRIARSGRSVVYVTHDVEEVFEIADRVVVLQRGQVIHDGPLRGLTRLELLTLMSGRNRKEVARTLKAVEAERFKIERNLHDGAQAELLSAAMMVGTAADALGQRADPELADLLRNSRQTIRQALGQLRNLSRGIYPVVLSEGGLTAALPSLADRSPLPMELDVDVPRLPENVELAAYFVVAEALTNAQKHANCTTVRVHARHQSGMLSLDIADDGIGGADESRGTGLAGLRARVRALDGYLTVSSVVGAGTKLEVRLPAAARKNDAQLAD